MDNGNSGIMPVMPIGGYGDGFGGNNSFMWIFGLLILMSMFNGGGFGGWGNNGFANAIGFENLATSNEVQRGFDNQNQMANQREILSAVTNGTAQAVAATNSTFHDTLAVFNDKYNELQRDIAGLAVGQANALANQNQCCCDIRLEMANQSAATNANFTAQIQSVKDMIAQDKIENLQAQVSQLQLAQATAGMLKFPNSWTYGAGPFPPIFGGCCGNNGFNNI